MNNNRLLYDAYTIYYNKGMEALEAYDYVSAKRNFISAAETLIKIAKESTGDLKKRRLNRAEELYSLVEKLNEKISSGQKGNSAANDLSKIGVDYKTKLDKSKTQKQQVNEEEFANKFQPSSDTGISLDDVAGLEEAKEEVRRLVIEPQLHPEIYKRFKREGGGGILLYGVPGTGKTMLAQAIAHELDAKFFSVKCSDIMSKWVGDSEQSIKALFNEAHKYPSSIIFFDEFESIGTKRSESNSSVMKRIVPELLEQIQGFDKNGNNLLIIAATNCPWDIDSAFLRSGRFSKRIYVPLPDEPARLAIVKGCLNDVPLEDSVDFTRIVDVTKGYSGADIKEFCNKIKDSAIDRTIKSKSESKINMNDIEYAIKMVPSSVQEKDLKRMADYEAKTIRQ